MATVIRPPVRARVLVAKPRPNVDREQLRERINAKYKNTLAYLGR